MGRDGVWVAHSRVSLWRVVHLIATVQLTDSRGRSTVTLSQDSGLFGSGISGLIEAEDCVEGHAVKRSRFTEKQEVCRKMGVGDATLYSWRKKYGASTS
ncbi:hypothetical protein KBTX_03199 [wastewater metagenome]|uniref:Transposase n=2 Tax=unclassified sequences TaxID=12908 RepID=A0A5B8RG70_9ZZZZ|nr:hypothetical protein KBTEX_03199 [uncultured organism]